MNPRCPIPKEESLLRQIGGKAARMRFYQEVRKDFRLLAWGLGASLLLALLLMPFDTGLMALLKAHTGPMARKVAVVFTNIGAFDGICIYPTLIMLLWGWARKLPRWRRHALLYMTTILLVGLAANILRGGLGRARPGNPDGWYGPTIKSKYNSFPSAHASVAGASFAYVLVACPPASVPVGAIALGICWSRVQLERHRPSDIVFGAGLGFTIAFVFNRALRRTFSLGGPPTESTTVAGPPHPPS